MRVDFYQLSRDPVERVVAMLAEKVLGSGNRLLVVSGDVEQRQALSRALWTAGPESFLANGSADRPNAARQPILLAADTEAANDAKMVCLADGKWREEALGFERALLLFGADERDAAAALWRDIGTRDGVQREIHKQDDRGKWRAGA